MNVRYIITVIRITILLSLFSSCQEAKLPLIDAAKVQVYAEWKDYSFHFSAEVHKSENVEIEERGFVFEFPKFDYYESWNDYDFIQEIFIVSDSNSFEYWLKRNLPPGLPCRVHAYIKTNYGNFRSENKEIQVTDQEPPIITSVFHDPDKKPEGVWGEGGTVYIEGTGFSDMLRRNYLWVTDETNEGETMVLEVVKASATKIEAVYSQGSWNKIGKFPLHLRVGKVECLSKAYFEMKGIVLVSVEPSSFCYGEEVTLHLDGYQVGEEFHISLLGGSIDSTDPFKVTSVADNEIRVRMYPQCHEDVSVCFYDKDYKYSPSIPVIIINPWQQIGSYDWLQVFDEYSEFCSYKGKGYVFDREEQCLRCYDTATCQWKSYPFKCEEMDFADMRQLFGAGNYVYMLVRFQKTESDTWELKDWQKLYRFDIDTHIWERLEDVANNMNELVYATYVLWDERTVYLHSLSEEFLRIYHADSDVWEKTKIKMPSHCELIGKYDGYLYYTNNKRDFYRMNPNSPDKEEKVFDGSCLISNVRGTTMKDNYIYFQHDYGMFRKDVSEQSLKLEPLGGYFTSHEWYSFHEGAFFLLDDGIYYLNLGKMYKYSE